MSEDNCSDCRECEQSLVIAERGGKRARQVIKDLGFGMGAVGRMTVQHRAEGNATESEVWWVKYIDVKGERLREVDMVTRMQTYPIGPERDVPDLDVT